MTGNEYQKLAARTIAKDMAIGDQIMHALHGMASEVGEIHGIYQKSFQGHIIDPVHVMSELGDLLWFAVEFSTALGWDIEEVMQLNIRKLKARYPGGFEAEKSLHRREGDI